MVEVNELGLLGLDGEHECYDITFGNKRLMENL